MKNLHGSNFSMKYIRYALVLINCPFKNCVNFISSMSTKWILNKKIKFYIVTCCKSKQLA